MINYIHHSCAKLCALLLVMYCSNIQIVDAGETTRVSIDPSGNQFFGFGIDNHIAISADGRYVVFIAIPNDTVVAGYTHKDSDIYIHDRTTKLTSRLNINSKKGGKDFSDFSISADARYIAFSSSLDDLVPGDTNFQKDVFVHDRETSATTRVSDNGGEYPQLSGDGHFVFYAFDNTTPECIRGVISYDIFSGSSSCILDNPSHGYADFVVSFDGRYLAFVDPFQVYSYDRSIPVTNTITQGTGYTGRIVPGALNMTADGRYILYYACSAAGLSCTAEGIFIYDRASGITSKINIGDYNPPAGVFISDSVLPNSASISADGRYLAFQMYRGYDAGYFGRTDFTAVSGTSTFVMDRTTGAISRVSINTSGVNEARAGVFDVWDGSKGLPAISADGSVVAFVSTSSDLVSGDTNELPDVFVHDRLAGGTSILPDLSVVLTDSPNPVTINNPLNYSVTITNNGSVASTGVQLSLNLPNEVSLVSAPSGCSLTGNTVSCAIGSLTVGQQVTRTIVVNPTVTGSLTTNTSVSGNESESNSVNNSASAVTTVTAATVPQVSSDLSIALSTAKTVKVTKKLTYTFTVANKGKVAVSAIVVTDDLPPTVNVVKKPNYCSVSGSQLTCAVGKLKKKTSKSFSVIVKPTKKGVITNFASLTSVAVFDAKLLNNTVSKSTTVK